MCTIFLAAVTDDQIMMNHDKAFERYFIFTADLDFQTKIVMISAL
jgi:hypothetical protein